MKLSHKRNGLVKTISACMILITILSLFTACSIGKIHISYGDTAASEADTVADDTQTAMPATEVTTAADQDSSGDIIICQVGQEVTTEDFTFTVTKIDFTQNVGFEHVSTYYYPVQEYATAKEGYTWLSYYVDFTFHGNKEIFGQIVFTPAVLYGDYAFYSNYFMEKCVDGKWGGLRSNFDAAPYYGVEDYDFKYDPFVDHTYSLHGAIEVPIKAVNDTETEMEFEIRVPYNGGSDSKYAFYDVRSIQ